MTERRLPITISHYVGVSRVVLARFVPVVRTFCPIVAGASRMEHRTFLRFNIVGGVLWGAGVTALG